MAKKKDKGLTYLQMPLPEARKYSQDTVQPWSGLYRRPSADTGTISYAENISLEEYPYITPAQSPSEPMTLDGKILGALGYDNKLVVVYRPYDSEKKKFLNCISVNYIEGDNTFTGVLNDYSSDDKAPLADYSPRSIVRFNVYDNPTDPVGGSYIKKLLIFPDKASMPAEIGNAGKGGDDPLIYGKLYRRIEEDEEEGEKTIWFYAKGDTYEDVKTDIFFPVDGMDVLIREYEGTDADPLPPASASHNYYYLNTTDPNKKVYRWVDDLSDSSKSGWQACVPPSFPPIKYAAVHLSRLFGVSDDRVYASGFNDYTNWNLDTVTEYNEANAWCTPSQSNTNADGNFTGITVFGGHVVCFKKDFMHEIYNTKNPFRIQDIYADGTIDFRSVKEVGGKLIFAAENGIKVYTGGAPKDIGYPLGIDSFEKAIAGTDGRKYYLYCKGTTNANFLFVYDTHTGFWSQQNVPKGEIVSFACNDNGMYAFCNDGTNAYIYKLDSGVYSTDWRFETDFMTGGTLDVKRIKAIKILADIDKGASFKVNISYDGNGNDDSQNQLLYDSGKDSDKKTGRIAVRVKVRGKAYHGMKLIFEGSGYVRIYNLEISTEGGGEPYATK